jgi:hypothetical protein
MSDKDLLAQRVQHTTSGKWPSSVRFIFARYKGAIPLLHQAEITWKYD